MLIINPTSTCDVCLEGYSSDNRQPHAIPCGHVFCKTCLEALLHTACPLCRSRFHPADIRRLHIDSTSSPGPNHAEDETPTVLPPGSTAEVRVLLDTAKTYLRNGAPATQFRELAHKCSSWMRHNPPEKHGDMYLLTKLLLNTAEWYAKLHEAQAQVRRSDRELESIRAHMFTELQEADRKYQELFQLHQNERAVADSKLEELLRLQRDERETALAVEKSLRDHHEKLDREWRDRYDRLSYIASDNRRPRGCTCTDGNCANNSPNNDNAELLGPMAVDNSPPTLPDLAVTASEETAVVKFNAVDASSSMNDIKTLRNIWDKSPGPNQMIYFLSPLPLSDGIAITSAPPTAPLPKEDSDPSIPPGFVPYSSPILEPTPVRPRAQREPSGLAMSRPTTLYDEPTLSRSLPSQGPDILMRSPLSSPTIRPASTTIHHQSTPSHRDHSVASPSRLTEAARHVSASSEQIDEGERHRAQQLHELLDSPVVPSRLPQFISQSFRTESPFQPPPRTGSSSSNQHSRTQSADVIPMSSSLGRSHNSSRARSSSSAVEPTTSSSYSRSNVHPPMVYPQQALDTPNLSSSHAHSFFHPPMLSPLQTSSGTPSNSSVRSHPGLIRHDSHRKMSSASSAAQAIEREQKERRKAEREREKEQERLFKEREEREREAQKERERELARQHQKQQRTNSAVGATSSSLRDSTNATHGSSQPHNRLAAHSSIGNGKGRMGMHGVPPPTSVGYV